MLRIRYIDQKYQEEILVIKDAHQALIPHVGNTIHHDNETGVRIYLVTNVSFFLSEENQQVNVYLMRKAGLNG